MSMRRRRFLSNSALFSLGTTGFLLSACGSAFRHSINSGGTGGSTASGGNTSGGGGGGSTTPPPPTFFKTSVADLVAISPRINASFTVSAAAVYTFTVATGVQRSMMILDDKNRAAWANRMSYTQIASSSGGFQDVFLSAGTYWLVCDNLSGAICGEVDMKQRATGGAYVETVVKQSGVVRQGSQVLIPLTIASGFHYVARGCSTFLRADIVRANDVQQVGFEWDLGGSHVGDTCPWSVLSLYPEDFYIRFAYPPDQSGGYACHIEKWKSTG